MSLPAFPFFLSPPSLVLSFSFLMQNLFLPPLPLPSFCTFSIHLSILSLTLPPPLPAPFALSGSAPLSQLLVLSPVPLHLFNTSKEAKKPKSNFIHLGSLSLSVTLSLTPLLTFLCMRGTECGAGEAWTAFSHQFLVPFLPPPLLVCVLFVDNSDDNGSSVCLVMATATRILLARSRDGWCWGVWSEAAAAEMPHSHYHHHCGHCLTSHSPHAATLVAPFLSWPLLLPLAWLPNAQSLTPEHFAKEVDIPKRNK